jgi:hypothetical protein
MQIIFEEKLIPTLREKYTILELDTIMQPGLETPMTLYALIETVDLASLNKLPELINQHQILVDAYKNNKFDVAEFNANALMGQWKGELDEFYQSVVETVQAMRNNNEIWNGVRHTTPNE